MKKDYLNSKRTQKFQAGGPAPAGGAPQGPQGGGGGPESEIQAMLQEVIETQNPELALQTCNKLYEMLTGEGAAPSEPQAPPMPAGGGQEPQGGMPMGRYGMKTKPVMPK